MVSRHAQSIVDAVAPIADQSCARDHEHADIEQQHADERAVDPRIGGETECSHEHTGRGKNDHDGGDLGKRARAIDATAACDAMAQTSCVIDGLIPVEKDLLWRRIGSRVATGDAKKSRALLRIDLDTADPTPR